MAKKVWVWWRDWNRRLASGRLYRLWLTIALLSFSLSLWMSAGLSQKLPWPLSFGLFWNVEGVIVAIIIVLHSIAVATEIGKGSVDDPSETLK